MNVETRNRRTLAASIALAIAFLILSGLNAQQDRSANLSGPSVLGSQAGQVGQQAGPLAAQR